MGKPNGFLEFDRNANEKISPKERIKNFDEFYVYKSEQDRKNQASRCMNCGVPFCGSAIELNSMVTGCPLHNLIPEWNDEIYQGNYSHALSRLLKTNPFPEFTGRVCPALCEKACINAMFDAPVTVHDNELFIIETAFKNGKMQAKKPLVRSDKKVAIIGSGPAGLTVSEKLNKRGHNVTVYERDDRFGGLLMYGIPNMKLDKKIIERRIKLMSDEGVNFVANRDLGKNLSLDELNKNYDAIVLCCGAKKARDINVENRDLNEIMFAVDYLSQSTKGLLENNLNQVSKMTKGKNVIVVGGGDTGNDCVGTSLRLGAKSVTQLEIMPKLSDTRQPNNPWPEWPKVTSVDYGQEEAIAVLGTDPRVYQTTIKEIYQKDGKLTGILTTKVEFKDGKLCDISGSEQKLDADLILIAAGFTGYEDYFAKGLKIPSKENITFKTDKDNIFACGDIKRGQSLVVWAISDALKCASEIDAFLMRY